MAQKMEPKLDDETLVNGKGGAYYSWSSDKFPLLSEAKLLAGKLLLHPFGLALPHYSDAAKIGYVLQGTCKVGMVKPGSSSEEVVVMKKGDAIPVPMGVISWWYNPEDSQVEIIFLGDSSKALIAGKITYFCVTGPASLVGNSSFEFAAKAFNLNEKDSQTLTKSQTGLMIVKLDGTITLPSPSKHNLKHILYAKIDGDLSVLTETNFGLLATLGLSANYMKLGRKEMVGPVYTTDSSTQMVYVIKGTGRVQITGATGMIEMESDVKQGELFVVPKFYPFALNAGENGIECFSVTTSSKPEFGLYNGNKSIWKAFSVGTLQVSLGITKEFAKLFKSNV